VLFRSPLTRIFQAEDKLVQIRTCLEESIPVPKTVLVTRPSRIPPEFGHRVVVKPLAAGHYRDAQGAGRVVHATALERSDPVLELLAGAPFLVQEVLESVSHLRVVTVGHRAWACELPAKEFPLDWRAAEAAHGSFEPTSRPEVERQAVAIAARLGVGYSSQDWIVDPHGTAYFLDLNPAGQWLFLPHTVSDEVSATIASYLNGREVS
jgi:glutathione synthase/RimK-type ligase-like ATP-grasp enzyme